MRHLRFRPGQGADSNPVVSDPVARQEALLDEIWARHPGFTAAENLGRDALYDRHALSGHQPFTACQ